MNKQVTINYVTRLFNYTMDFIADIRFNKSIDLIFNLF